ncbi:MAG TPA: hypothetical protein VEQ36_08545 [Thermomicrobiales bacterium]|nr:hypothetical protein [Thermomicrobiales bacterium]
MISTRTMISRRVFVQRSALIATGVAIGAVARGQVSLGNSAVAATPDATATREAELEELNSLQTQVAQPLVCTPAPTSTPSPTATQVPPSQTGVPLVYGNIWTITVLGIFPAMSPQDARLSGKLMQVNLTASHNNPVPKLPPLTELRLVDSQGRFSVPDIALNQSIFGSDWGLHVSPGVTANLSVVFDVAADAGDSFILESNADPTFRVAMTVEQRG